MKIVAVIPARLASTRFPRKVLLPISGIPMVEHVRRRALLCKDIDDVIVATCDNEVAEVVKSFGGQVIMTSENHKNGTTRVSEALLNIDCTHVILMQGDEPLLLPRHVSILIEKMRQSSKLESVWNLVAKIDTLSECDKHSIVKCSLGVNNHILYCYRKSPHFSDFNLQEKFVRKMLGVIAFEKNFLLDFVKIDETPIEVAESIEQMRIIEAGFNIAAITVDPALPSINEHGDVDFVLEKLFKDDEQLRLLDHIKTL